MDRRRKLDVAGLAKCRRSLIRRAAVFLIVFCGIWSGQSILLGQDSSANGPAVERQIQELFSAGKWQEIVNLVAAAPSPSADIDFYYGTALARLSRWDEARQAFLAGHFLRPKDERFLVELAGVAFKQKHYAQAATNLRHALR